LKDAPIAVSASQRKAREKMIKKKVVLLLIVIVMLYTTASVFGSTETHEDVDKEIAKLSSANFRERSEGSKELVRIGLPAVKPLISALGGEARELRWRAALILGKIKDPNSVSPLIDALKDRYWLVRFWAAWSLGEIRDATAVEPLVAVLNDPELLVVRMTLDSLREITGEGFGRDPRVWENWLEKNGEAFGKQK
jgi:HEAT repeat protein